MNRHVEHPSRLDGLGPSTFRVWAVVWVAVGACGSPESGDSAPPAREETAGADAEPAADDEVVLGALSGGSLRAALDPPPEPEEPPPSPASRASAGARASIAIFAAVEPLHAAATAVEVGTDRASADMTTAVAGLRDRVEEAEAAARSALAGYEPLFHDAAHGAEARTRAGDLLDSVAATIAAARFPLPVQLADQVAEASADVRAEVQETVDDAIHQVLLLRTRPLFCDAARHYGAAGTPRAREQLARYGPVFLESCP